MEKSKYYPPKHGESNFHCPNCKVYAHQLWSNIGARSAADNQYLPTRQAYVYELDDTWTLSTCNHCREIAIWLNGELIFPYNNDVQSPNQDLPENIKKYYEEASKIINYSPRASAALLRLAIQELFIFLGEKGENINEDIGNLVKKGLNPQIQKTLDILRVTGNNAVHPGKIEGIEKKEEVLKLFGLLNFIADKMISEPNEINSMYESLPVSSKKQIEKRDGTNS